jgi:hypothetical protein
MFANDRKQRRESKRQQSFMTATIALAATPRKRILCFVRNIANDGARLELTEATALPPRFVLEMRDDHVARNAMLIWRDGRHLGVSFREASVSPVATPVEAVQPLGA